MTLPVYATEVKITNPIYQDHNFGQPGAGIKATFTLSWKNAWRNNKNYDAIWVFFKLHHAHEDRTHRHARIKANSFQLNFNYLQNGIPPAFRISPDSLGVIIYPGQNYRGDLSWRITLELDISRLQSIYTDRAIYVVPHAIEMVQIPSGAFYAGSPDTSLQKDAAAIHHYESKQPFHISSEAAIPIGQGHDQLYYYPGEQQIYRGDVSGVLHDDFPKGYAEFFIMKYELTEGQYTAFLNSISSSWSSNRSPVGAKQYEKNRGGIRLKDGLYFTLTPHRPANFLSFDDQCAFADWAALRPMTELEYEKACRGPNKPISNDFPWGGPSRDKVSRYYNSLGELLLEENIDESKINDQNLEFYGASYYWVMDLNKSLWERCVTIGHPKGRSFLGSHGDGNLSGYYGDATNPDWPNNREGGLSYRGGGTYEFGMVGSPQGTVAERTFAAWADGPRTIAYGFRAVRSW